ncbi:aspartic proteinase Asp1 isoform X2 [Ricinus communis]|uniref:aspartic proteinase Asp1 isoform X2 n=1 Tax=Ricinus communis TaxID=3988 RepID=UPI0007721EF7|nr:aspartic proteinase Asp1 isoform X2 [Ricinus communis]|eukprot:XP_002520345.2 aspartic proteinase Asp1 [Ricinus communis]
MTDRFRKMEKKRKRRRFSSLLMQSTFFIVLAATFEGSFSAASQRCTLKKSTQHSCFGSSLVLPVFGNVYPLGYYSVSLYIGNPPKLFELDIDTGSDLTWVQCDAPCTGCTKPLHHLYKPRNNLLSCIDPLCSAVQNSGTYQCQSATDQCDYEIQYADEGSSLGVLVTDYFPLRLMNGSFLRPKMTFGCGYDQKSPGPVAPPPTTGVLGLGNGKTSIISQLQALGVMGNVIGHCLSRKGGGFLFFGQDPVPSFGISWAPMSQKSLDKYYASGPAELLYGGKPTGTKAEEFIFDSGSSYTYFNAQVYQSTLNLIRKELSGKPLRDAPEEKALAICWKGTKRFKSVNEVKSYFKPFALSFTKAKSVQLQIPPEDYLIVTNDGNVCLGILNGSEVGLGNFNVIGDNLFQDKLVIYDSDKHQIGWIPANCDRLPNLDRYYNEGYCQPYEPGYGFTEKQCQVQQGDKHRERCSKE